MSVYNSSGKEPFNDPSYAVKLNNLQNIQHLVDVNEASKFVHDVIDQVCGKEPNFFILYPKSFKNIKAFNECVEAYALFFSRISSLYLGDTKVVEDLKIANVPEQFIKIITEAIRARVNDIKLSMVIQSTSISYANLADFDWKLQAILSSDKLSGIHEPILILNLTITQEDRTKKDILVEFTKSELDNLLAVMAEINKVVQKLKV